MKITMLETRPGADDGVRVATYEKGATYDVSDALAKCFLDAREAKKAGAKAAVATPEADGPAGGAS